MSNNKIKTDKSAKISYYFITDSMDGSLMEPKFEILVQFRQRSNFTHKIELSTNHKHHLPTMFIDVDGNKKTDGNKPNISVHPKPERTLKTYFQLLAAEGVRPVMVYQRFIHPSHMETAYTGYNYVPIEVRMIIKAIISAVLYLHRRKGSLLGALGWDNFVIYDGYLALRSASYCESGQTTRTVDFGYVYDFIANEIFGDQYLSHIPIDMQKLLHTLRYYPRCSYANGTRKFVACHFATMSHSERIYFMMNCSDKEHMIVSSSGSNHYFSAITNLPSQRGWKNKIVNSSFPAVISCFQRGQPYYYDEDFEESTVKRSAIRCCRNLATHLGEYLALSSQTFTDMDIDMIVSSIFAAMLVDFSWKLLHQNVLNYVITWMEEV